MNSKSRRLEIPSKFSNPRSLLHFLSPTARRIYQLRKEYRIYDPFQRDPFNMIEVRLSRLENICRNKKTLPTQSLTIPNTSNHIDEN